MCCVRVFFFTVSMPNGIHEFPKKNIRKFSITIFGWQYQFHWRPIWNIKFVYQKIKIRSRPVKHQIVVLRFAATCATENFFFSFVIFLSVISLVIACLHFQFIYEIDHIEDRQLILCDTCVVVILFCFVFKYFCTVTCVDAHIHTTLLSETCNYFQPVTSVNR